MSERSLDVDLKSGSQSSVFSFVVFVELSFPSGTVRVHNGIGTYNFNSNDWLGVGALGGITMIEETIDGVPTPITLSLSSINEDIISAIRTDNVYGRDAKIYLGAINPDQELQGTPTLWVDGYIEKKVISLGQESEVGIVIQDDAARLNQRNNKRFTLEDHQSDWPDDKFFEFLPVVMNAEVTWAGEKVRSGFTNEDGLGGSGSGRRRRGGFDRNRRGGRRAYD